MSDLQHPDNFPVGYDRGHKATCAWPDCPGGISCEGLSADEDARGRVAEVVVKRYLAGGANLEHAREAGQEIADALIATGLIKGTS